MVCHRHDKKKKKNNEIAKLMRTAKIQKGWFYLFHSFIAQYTEVPNWFVLIKCYGSACRQIRIEEHQAKCLIESCCFTLSDSILISIKSVGSNFKLYIFNFTDYIPTYLPIKVKKNFFFPKIPTPTTLNNSLVNNTTTLRLSPVLKMINESCYREWKSQFIIW